MRTNPIACCAILATLALPACGGNDPIAPGPLGVLALSGTYIVDLTEVISTLIKQSWVILPLLLPWLVIFIAARRFEKRRKDQGAWNESGPIDPTYAPTNPTLRAVGMRLPTIERAGVDGAWDVSFATSRPTTSNVNAALAPPATPRDARQEPPQSTVRGPKGATSGGASDGGASGEVEIAHFGNGVITRGRTTPPTVRPGTEREAFLAAAAGAVEEDVRRLDLDAPIVARYGADEFQVYECVQRAEDIWRVQLLPHRIPVANFEAALEPFRSLDAIIAAAEAAARSSGRQ